LVYGGTVQAQTQVEALRARLAAEKIQAQQRQAAFDKLRTEAESQVGSHCCILPAS
jgi:hypothetical protein